MGLSWQQGPLGRDPNGAFFSATPMPERVLSLEPLRRRISVELVLGHAADPYHRIDIRRRSRHLVVRQDDRVVATASGPLVLYESGFAPRWYVSRADVAGEALRPVEGQTSCPYKGLASSYDAGHVRNAAWSYRAPFDEVVIAHGPDRNLSVDEIGGIQLVEDAAGAEA